MSGKRYWSDDTLVAGQQFEYGFDDIGNRTNTSQGGDDEGNNMRSSTYTSNYQNELTAYTVPSYKEIQGTANAAATVKVNGFHAERQGEYFRYELPVSNLNGSVNTPVTVTSTIGAETESSTGYVYTARTNAYANHDADGNLTYDGRGMYTWNGENRLIALQTSYSVSGGAPTGVRIEYQYDGKGRRIEKKILRYNWSAGTYNDPIETWTYIYDGWNLLAEIKKYPSSNQHRTYAWGPDLSGTLQGAGGVGGLLMVTQHGNSHNNTHYVGNDANGNVTLLVNADTATQPARYEYGPFGEPLRASGETIATEYPFRFSTKFTDKESGFLYYGFRYYNPETGRWLNRDPIAEKGGLNLYGFANNSPKKLD